MVPRNAHRWCFCAGEFNHETISEVLLGTTWSFHQHRGRQLLEHVFKPVAGMLDLLVTQRQVDQEVFPPDFDNYGRKICGSQLPRLLWIGSSVRPRIHWIGSLLLPRPQWVGSSQLPGLIQAGACRSLRAGVLLLISATKNVAISAAISTAPCVPGDACSARQVPGGCAAGCLTKRSQVLFSVMASLLALPHSGHFSKTPWRPRPCADLHLRGQAGCISGLAYAR